MNGAWTDVQNWLDIIDHIWIGLVLVAVAGIPSWISAKNGKGIQKIQDQVVNGHKSPMRSDLDKVIESLEKMSHSLHVIKEELASEEHRRKQSIMELREELDRKFSDLLQRFIR